VAASGRQHGRSVSLQLRDRERWTLLDNDRVMVIHPDRSAKVVYPDGRVEEIA